MEADDAAPCEELGRRGVATRAYRARLSHLLEGDGEAACGAACRLSRTSNLDPSPCNRAGDGGASCTAAAGDRNTPSRRPATQRSQLHPVSPGHRLRERIPVLR